MASVKLVYGSTTETCWSSTSKITTPSLILVDGSTTRYTPLFSGSAGGYGYSGYYRYTLGHLIVADRRVALSQQQYKFDNSASINHHNNTMFSTAYSYRQSYYPYTTYYTHYYSRGYYISKETVTTNRGTFQYIRNTLNGGVNANQSSWTNIRTDTNTYTIGDQSNRGWYPGVRSAGNGDRSYAYWTTSGCTNNDMVVYTDTVPWNNFVNATWYVTVSGQFQLA